MSAPTFRNTKAQWPISLQELKARRNEEATLERRHSTIYTVVLFVFLFANFPLFFLLDDLDQITILTGSIWMVFFLGLLMASLPLMLRVGRRRLAAFDLYCPSCHEELSQSSMKHALATGCCVKCGTQLVSDPPAAK